MSVTWESHLGFQSSLVPDKGDDTGMGPVVFIFFIMAIIIIFICSNRADV